VELVLAAWANSPLIVDSNIVLARSIAFSASSLLPGGTLSKPNVAAACSMVSLRVATLRMVLKRAERPIVNSSSVSRRLKLLIT
jgi:hypothetical protein